jgi:cell division septation protein DedD
LNFFVFGALFADGYHVCVASYKSLKNAETMVQKLEKQSMSAFISESKVKNQNYYRVLLSKEFKKIDDARKYRDEVKKIFFC